MENGGSIDDRMSKMEEQAKITERHIANQEEIIAEQKRIVREHDCMWRIDAPAYPRTGEFAMRFC